MTKKLLPNLTATLALVGFGAIQTAWADKIEPSTADNPKWYRVYTPNRENMTMTSHGPLAPMISTSGVDTPDKDGQLWRFEEDGEGKYNIISMDGTYVNPSQTTGVNNGYGDSYILPTAEEPSAKWTVTAVTGQEDLYIVASGGVQLHQGNHGTNWGIINYGGGSNTSDAGCQFRFKLCTLSDLDVAKAKARGLATLRSAVGTNPGQYPQEATTTFTQAIETATTTAAIEEAKKAYEAARISVTAGSTYYIKSHLSKDYCEGKYAYAPGKGQQPKWGDKLVNSQYAWTFEDAGEGKFYIKNLGTGEYIEPNSTGNTGATTTSATHTTKYSVSYLGQGVFNLTPDGKNPLHAQQAGAVVVMWEGGIGSASSWAIETISEEDLKAPASITGATALPGSQTYAPGNKEQVLLKATASVGGFSGTVKANSITIDFGATAAKAAADLENVKVFTSTNTNFVGESRKDAKEVGVAAAVEGQAVTVNFADGLELPTGTTTFYITADIKTTATVGDSIDAVLKNIVYNTDKTLDVNANPEGQAQIFSVESMPYKPYDLKSHYWRIPAMVVLHNQKGENAKKNGRIVTMADMRFDHGADLPNHIDVYERHSDDGGKTWSDAQLIAGNKEDEALVPTGQHGFGDAAIVETANGKLVGIMVAGAYYFSSTPAAPNIPFIVTSDDGGETWTSPKSLYNIVYNSKYSQGQVQGSFAGSGRGLLLKRQKDPKRNGRIMFAMSHRFTSGGIQEYIIYSDDEGTTWHMSPNSAYSGGDESKLVELEDGTVMISVRQNGNRGFNTSTDGGMTWGTQSRNATITGNACNGDILYYNKHVLLHSYINDPSRKNVTVAASFDNGKTWVNQRTICAPSSVYSTMDILPNGDIAMLYEDGACSDGLILNYVSFPVKWIVPEDPAKSNLKNLVSQARNITSKTGYTDHASSTIGQCNQESIDALAAILPTDAEIGKLTEFDALSDKIEAAIEACKQTCTTVPGYANTTLFAISSYENISNYGEKGFFTTSASTEKATAETAQQWQFVPADAEGRAFIKAKGEEKYLMRTDNALVVQSNPADWLVSPSEGGYVNLIATHKADNSFLVVNTTNGSFNWWSNADGSAEWSTKYVLTKVGEVETGIGSATIASPKTEEWYDLSGRRVANPAKGVFFSNKGKKAIFK